MKPRVPTTATLLAVCMALLCASALAANEMCKSGTCLANGEKVCDRATGTCPPCMYAITGGYSCYAKTGNACPFPDTLTVCSEARSENLITRASETFRTALSSVFQPRSKRTPSTPAPEVGTVAPPNDTLVSATERRDRPRHQDGKQGHH